MAQIIFNESSLAPSTPAAGQLAFYAKTDNNLYTKDHLGNEVAVSSGSGISQLTGDVSATGPGIVAAVVNSIGGSSASNVHAAELLANAATASNTASAIVRRDSSGNFSAGTITANLTGNASGSAASFTGSLAGDVTGHQATTTVAFVGGSSAATIASAVSTVSSATSSNSGNTLVKRDGSGNFSAGTITASFTGDISGTATNATNIKPVNLYTNADLYPALLVATGAFEQPQVGSNFTFNPISQTLKVQHISCSDVTATYGFTGPLTGIASKATQIYAGTEYTNAACKLVFVDSGDTWQNPGSSANITFNPATSTLTTGTVVANLTGDVTGNASGTAGKANQIYAGTDYSAAPCYPVFVDAHDAWQNPGASAYLTFNPATQTLTTGTVVANLTGNATSASSVSGTVAVANGGTGATTALLARQNLGTETVFNGIEDASQFTISYSATNRQFSIATTASAAFTVGGVRYVPGAGTVTTTAHANTTGQWFCYYAAGGVLTVSSTPWDLLSTAPITFVYYTTANNGGGPDALLYYELHAGDKGMSPATHKNLHLTRGTQLLSGIAISGYTLNSSGLANTSYALSAGQIADEDIIYATSAQPKGGTNTYRVAWKSGTNASPAWNWTDAASGGIFTDGTDIYYNQLTGGSWQLTSDTVQDTYVNYWVMATTTYGYPQIIVLMGQTTYATLAAAQASTFSTEMSQVGSLTQEGVIIYQLTYHRNNTFGTPGNVQLASVAKITESLTAISIGTSNTQAVNVSTNTSSFTGRLNSSATNVQLALQQLDTSVTPVLYGGTGQTSATAAFNALVPMTTTGDLVYESGTNTASRLAIGTTGQLLTVASGVPAWQSMVGTVGASISGGGAAIQAGLQGFIQVPYNGTITGWSILADRVGSIVVDIWKVPYASFPSTISNTITGSALPTISSAQMATSNTLTGWTTSISAGDVLTFNVTSATTIQQATIELRVNKQ